jgi:hypothetical protein
MKVEIKEADDVGFCQLEFGEAFEHEGDIYVKYDNGGEKNAVSLNKAKRMYFGPHITVKAVKHITVTL